MKHPFLGEFTLAMTMDIYSHLSKESEKKQSHSTKLH